MDKLAKAISSTVGGDGLQRLTDYVKYFEMTAKSKAKQADVHKLADEVNRKWWAKNKKRLLGA